MDELDLQLMRRIGVTPFLVWPHPLRSMRPSSLARSLKVSTDTVKRRLSAMQEVGVFHGVRVYPNPRLLGLRLATLHFTMGAAGRKRVSSEQVAEVPGVLGVCDLVGGGRTVDVAFHDDAGRDALRKELARLLGATASQLMDYPAPRPTRKLSRLDWRILQALRSAADSSPEEAARSLGVSVRTVKRRFDRMAEDGALDVIGLFNPGAIDGHLIVELLVHLVPGSRASDIAVVLNALRSRWFAQWSPPDGKLGHLALLTVARSAHELEGLRREAESLASVERCEVLVFDGALQDWNLLDAGIGQRAASPLAVAPPARKQVPAIVAARPRAR